MSRSILICATSFATIFVTESRAAPTGVPGDRNGMAIGRNGRPRPPKRRTIDVRVGDDVMVSGRWRRVLDIRAYRESYAKSEQVEAVGAGYVVRREA